MNLQQFIKKKITLDMMVLPWFYPENNDLESFQGGYKIPEEEQQKGGFKASWWVICCNYFDDPFFVDFDEKEKGLPVYFAFHGQDEWIPILIASSLAEFEHILLTIRDIQKYKVRFLDYIQNNFDLNNPFWQEVYQTILEQ
ncbi:SMI1/KNR4 family protein [Capnocytophaga cynodegmi]|uniref:SMI1/KNR4 family protein n=1 Tax=Capnocytophaga cynodegmi TaxID=28189 RepID=UPI003859B85D